MVPFIVFVTTTLLISSTGVNCGYSSAIREQYEAGGSFAQSTPGATAFASSYLGPNNLFERQQIFFKQWQNAQAQAQANGNGFGPGSNFAYSSGTYGPNGFHQTAGIHPPNKDNPNIDNRFSPENNPNGSNNFFGISTSSFSSSSDVDGVKKHKEGAITAINDNGKVTIHKVEN